MVLPNNFIFISNFIAKLPQQKIAQVISVCLLVYIAFITAKITWLMIPNTSQAIIHTSVSDIKSIKNKSPSKTFDLSKMQSLNLFGIYAKAAVETTVVVKNAPETRLKLTLSGLVASDDVSIAAAIIEHKGKQDTYGVGDIILGTRASLEQVLIDRVLIKQSGRVETLMLDGFDFKQPAITIAEKTTNEQVVDANNQRNAIVPPSKVLDQRKNQQLSASASNIRTDLNKTPGNITDYLRISPKRENGDVVGYSLEPGNKAAFFKLSGLKRGDIAVQMNNFDLTNTSEALQAMATLKTESHISLLVKRKNDLIEILFSIE